MKYRWHSFPQRADLPLRSRTRPLGAVLLCWLAALLSLPAAEPSKAVCKIGLLAPPQAPEGSSLRQGAALGVERGSQISGLDGRLVIRGRPGQWGTDGDEAAGLALDEGVTAMIAPPDGAASHQVVQVAGRTRIPVVSLCPDSSVTHSGIPWVIRIVPRTDTEALTLFSGSTSLGVGKDFSWAGIVPESRAGREAAKDLLKAAAEANCSLTQPLRLPRKESDWPAMLERLLATRPAGLLLWLDDPSTAGRLAKMLRVAGYRGLLCGPARFRTEAFIASAGQSSEGFLLPAISQAGDDVEQRRFRKAYAKQFGCEPDFTALMAHDAGLLLVQLIKESPDRPLYRTFPLPQEYTGASGVLRFDKDGNRQVPLHLLICRNLKWTNFPAKKLQEYPKRKEALLVP